MPLFKCEKCLCVENTAVSGYWMRHTPDDPILCSECDPKIGKWHGRFEKIQAAGAYVVGKLGYLITLEEAEQDKWADTMARDAKEIAHIGLEGVARTAFVRGWNYGAAYARKQLESKETKEEKKP